MEITVELKKNPCCAEIIVSETLEETPEGVKGQVQERYAQAAAAGCGCGCGDDNPFNMDSYEGLGGYEDIADLGLGCGTPTEHADIQRGHDVLDLGSGGGIDAFIARRLVGNTGSITGLDFTREMVDLARKNTEKLKFSNVRFVQGDIEEMPFDGDSFDRIISNCVINLVPGKQKAFAEMHRVLRIGGRFTLSDIILQGVLPPAIRKSAEAYVGCVSGVVTKKEYLDMLQDPGFTDVRIVKEQEIPFSDDDLKAVASKDEIQLFRESGAKVLSLTITGVKTQ